MAIIEFIELYHPVIRLASTGSEGNPNCVNSRHNNLSNKLPLIPIKLDLLNRRVLPGSHRKERPFEVPEVEGLTSAAVGYQVPTVTAHSALTATVFVNNRNANLVRGDDDMIFVRPGQARNSKLGAFSLGGDDEAVAVVPEDGGVALGADVGSISSSACMHVASQERGKKGSYALPDVWSGAN